MGSENHHVFDGITDCLESQALFSSHTLFRCGFAGCCLLLFTGAWRLLVSGVVPVLGGILLANPLGRRGRNGLDLLFDGLLEIMKTLQGERNQKEFAQSLGVSPQYTAVALDISAMSRRRILTPQVEPEEQAPSLQGIQLSI